MQQINICINPFSHSDEVITCHLIKPSASLGLTVNLQSDWKLVDYDQTWCCTSFFIAILHRTTRLKHSSIHFWINYKSANDWKREELKKWVRTSERQIEKKESTTTAKQLKKPINSFYCCVSKFFSVRFVCGFCEYIQHVFGMWFKLPKQIPQHDQMIQRNRWKSLKQWSHSYKISNEKEFSPFWLCAILTASMFVPLIKRNS